MKAILDPLGPFKLPQSTSHGPEQGVPYQTPDPKFVSNNLQNNSCDFKSQVLERSITQ